MRGLRGLVGLGVAGWLACAPPGSDAGLAVEVELEVERSGGLCPTADGSAERCSSVVTVRDDGTWSAMTMGALDDEGVVPPNAASGLAAILEQGWRQLTLQTFTDTCPTAFDGQEVTYRIRRFAVGPGPEQADTEIREVRSCTYDLGHVGAREVLDRLEEAWSTLGLPE